jgi:hypothetical protein
MPSVMTEVIRRPRRWDPGPFSEVPLGWAFALVDSDGEDSRNPLHIKADVNGKPCAINLDTGWVVFLKPDVVCRRVQVKIIEQ